MSATAAQGRAGLAVDGDPTTAWTARGKGRHSLVLDLGGAYDNIRKVGLVFPDAHGTYRYVVEASPDGDTWQTLVDRKKNKLAGRGEEHLVNLRFHWARYVFHSLNGRVKADESTYDDGGNAEFRLFVAEFDRIVSGRAGA